MNNLDTTNSNNYQYTTKHLDIHILGGLKTNKLESLRVTLSVAKTVIPAACAELDSVKAKSPGLSGPARGIQL